MNRRTFVILIGAILGLIFMVVIRAGIIQDKFRTNNVIDTPVTPSNQNGSLTFNEFKNIISGLLSEEDLQYINISDMYYGPHIMSPSGRKQFLMIDLPLMSGTGGVGGIIIEIDGIEKRAFEIGTYLGGGREFIFSPTEEYFIISESDRSGPSCIYSHNTVIKTGTSTAVSETLEPNLDSSLYEKLEDWETKYDLYIETSNPYWVNDKIIQFTAKISSCDFGSPSNSQLKSLVSRTSEWQYNVETGEYKLIETK